MQYDASYEEQLLEIKVHAGPINSYLYFINNGFVKNINISGFTDSGKIFVMM